MHGAARHVPDQRLVAVVDPASDCGEGRVGAAIAGILGRRASPADRCARGRSGGDRPARLAAGLRRSGWAGSHGRREFAAAAIPAGPAPTMTISVMSRTAPPARPACRPAPPSCRRACECRPPRPSSPGTRPSGRSPHGFRPELETTQRRAKGQDGNEEALARERFGRVAIDREADRPYVVAGRARTSWPLMRGSRDGAAGRRR